jgi:hypothetical protein
MKFGQTLEFKLKVNNKKVDPDQIYKSALTLCECGIGSFEECVEALRKFNCDEDRACQYLIDKNSNMANQ